MPVGSREGLGLPRTRKFACPTDSGWVAGRMDGLWGLGGCLGKTAQCGPSQMHPDGMQADPPKGRFLSAGPETGRS